MNFVVQQSGWQDSNLRQLASKARTLTRLSYTPMGVDFMIKPMYGASALAHQGVKRSRGCTPGSSGTLLLKLSLNCYSCIDPSTRLHIQSGHLRGPSVSPQKRGEIPWWPRLSLYHIAPVSARSLRTVCHYRVSVRGFEPPTSSTPVKSATRLRHTLIFDEWPRPRSHPLAPTVYPQSVSVFPMLFPEQQVEAASGSSRTSARNVRRAYRVINPLHQVAMPAVGVEPTRPFEHQLLRLACLPFHQTGRR